MSEGVADIADEWLQDLNWDEDDGVSFANDAPQELIAAFSEHNLTSKARSRIALEVLKALRRKNPDPQAVKNDPRSIIGEQDCPVFDEWLRIVREERPELIDAFSFDDEGRQHAHRRLFESVQDSITTIIVTEIEKQLNEAVEHELE